jgi:hypothetical protein
MSRAFMHPYSFAGAHAMLLLLLLLLLLMGVFV